MVCFQVTESLRRFVLSSPCSLRHCVTQSTEVLGRVAPVGWVFPQVEGGVIFSKLCLKAIDAFNESVSCDVFEEKLEALARILDVPKEVRCSTIRIAAFEL